MKIASSFDFNESFSERKAVTFDTFWGIEWDFYVFGSQEVIFKTKTLIRLAISMKSTPKLLWNLNSGLYLSVEKIQADPSIKSRKRLKSEKFKKKSEENISKQFT